MCLISFICTDAANEKRGKTYSWKCFSRRIIFSRWKLFCEKTCKYFINSNQVLYKIKLNITRSVSAFMSFSHFFQSLQPERNEEYLSCLLVGSEKDTWPSVCIWNQKIMAVYVLLEDWFVMSITKKKREPRTKEHCCVLSNYLFIACVLFCLLGWFSLVLLRY